MRWPDLFFKSRKARSTPEIATVPAKAPESTDSMKPGAPARTETAKVGAAMSERDKTDSLRALTETDNERAPLPTDKAGSDLPATQPVAGRYTPESDSSNAKTAALPVLTRPNTLSMRQRAKLTDDAHSLPKQEGDAQPSAKLNQEPLASRDAASGSSAPETASATGAVVPAAFTVPVETGSVLEASSDKPDLAVEAPKPDPAAPVMSSGPSESPATTAPSESVPSDTARVHLAHATTTGEAPSKAIEPVKAAPVDTREKQEFVLANGERILGHVLSETPQTIYLDHGTLGVLTLPRSQVAVKPIEVILINGDRIVGDLIAETPECLYIKHASLGMLTVPHNQRSARVVEAILKDGDRILGEVLAETENFTVIRSATLGTVAVQHEQVAMLNRKIEQMQLRALPNSAAVEDKKS